MAHSILLSECGSGLYNILLCRLTKCVGRNLKEKQANFIERRIIFSFKELASIRGKTVQN